MHDYFWIVWRRRNFLGAILVLSVAAGHVTAQTNQPDRDTPRFIDHSLLVAPEFPCTWPSYPFPRFQITHQRTIGPDALYNIDVLLIDGNTGTQLDAPPHSVARPELKREKSGPLGLAYTDTIPPWQFAGEACVVDVRDLLDQAPKGVSPLVTSTHIVRFEKQHRAVRFGDVVLFHSYSDYLDLWHHTHMMDAMAGTHLVPPSFALPPDGAKPAYSPEARGWLIEYEKSYGPRGASSITTEQVPLDWTCGPARVIDVRPLAGSTEPKTWPASPSIKPALVTAYEKEHGSLKSGEVVLFHTGHLDKYFKPRPEDSGVWSAPLSGKSEGWPAVSAETVTYLKKKGIRCIATDAPDLGGVDPKEAVMTYWALGSREMVGVEFLHNVGKIPEGAYFLFAPLKIRNCHGGPGRAIVLF